MLYSALQQILRPLIKLMLSRGLSFAEFSQVAKQIYVEQAETLLLQEQEKITTSRIAIRTGLTRKEVAKLRDNVANNDMDVSIRVNRGIRVINGWSHDEIFLDQEGKPAILNMQGENGFAALVQKYSGDMPYRALLKELIDSGLVSQTGEQVALQQLAYIPNNDEKAMIKLVGTDTAFLLSTMAHNLTPNQTSPFFQRKVCYDHLSAETLDTFKSMVEKDGMALLLKFNQWLSEKSQHQVQHSDSPSFKAGIGIYYFEQPSPPLRSQHA